MYRIVGYHDNHSNYYAEYKTIIIIIYTNSLEIQPVSYRIEVCRTHKNLQVKFTPQLFVLSKKTTSIGGQKNFVANGQKVIRVSETAEQPGGLIQHYRSVYKSFYV